MNACEGRNAVCDEGEGRVSVGNVEKWDLMPKVRRATTRGGEKAVVLGAVVLGEGEGPSFFFTNKVILW